MDRATGAPIGDRIMFGDFEFLSAEACRALTWSLTDGHDAAFGVRLAAASVSSRPGLYYLTLPEPA